MNRGRINQLYVQWLKESNKGHYSKMENFPDDPMQLFGNQDYVVADIFNVFEYYNIEISGNVLDIGCSMGGLLFSLYKTKKFHFIAGIDIDYLAIEMAKEYLKINNIPHDNFFIGMYSVYELPFDENSFDFVIMKDVCEHLESKENLEKAILEVMRVLKSGGWIFIEAPNYLFPFEPHLKIPILPLMPSKFILKKIANIFSKDVRFIEHLNLTTPRMIEKIFKRYNLIFYNAYVEYKLPLLINKKKSLSKRFKRIEGLITLVNYFNLNEILLKFLKTFKLYPTLWYIAKKP